jgi:hypothetical protein
VARVLFLPYHGILPPETVPFLVEQIRSCRGEEDLALFCATYERLGSLFQNCWRLILPWLVSGLLLPGMPGAAQRPAATAPAAESSGLFERVIADQKKSEVELDLYERIERLETRKGSGGHDPVTKKVWRVFPSGTGVDKIPLSPDGKPVSAESYRNDLQGLVKYLDWIAQEGSSQREAYAKAERKRKERFDLIEATHQAFIFTFAGKETRGDRTLLRYTLKPNPRYRPTSRNTTLFTKVRGTAWIDEQSSQLAKIEGSITEDVSLAIFLAKIYKGSHFMQERYEVAPGVWEPTYEQYDFDGRKFFSSFSIHECTWYSNYKRVGPPKESLEVVRAELSQLAAEPFPK